MLLHAAFESNHQLCIWKFGDEFSSESRRHFQYGGFLIWIFQLTSNEKFVSRLSDTLKFFSLLPLIGQPAYLPIWQIKMLHSCMYSIIRFTRLSCSIIQNVDRVTNFLFYFMVTIFQLGPWIRLSLDSHQLTIEETGLFQKSKNIKAFIRRYCKVLWLFFT